MRDAAEIEATFGAEGWSCFDEWGEVGECSQPVFQQRGELPGEVGEADAAVELGGGSMERAIEPVDFEGEAFW